MIKIDRVLLNPDDILVIGDYHTRFYTMLVREKRKQGKVLKAHPHIAARSVIVLRDGTLVLSTYSVKRISKLLPPVP